MGAGSKRITIGEKAKHLIKEGRKPCKYGCSSRSIVKGTENCRFLNTRKPYLIEECLECKRQYVREL